jgi:putative hemolysin
MLTLRKGRYAVRLAATPQDLASAQSLRALVFRNGHNVPVSDADAFDSQCRHVLVEETASGTLVAYFRLLLLSGGDQIGQSYSAQFYGLSALRQYPGRMVEMGRFCLHPDWHDPDILRIAWAALTRFVADQNVGMLFGCSSFRSTDATAYSDVFATLRKHHLAPERWMPEVKAPQVICFARHPQRPSSDPRRALLAVPPLLRTYLAMGGWVSDHAVVDRDLGTLHVFTGLEVQAIPSTRARLLRAIAS